METWQKPWKPGERRLPENVGSKKPYRGGNSVYLSVTQTAKGYSDNRWATYKHLFATGWHARPEHPRGTHRRRTTDDRVYDLNPLREPGFEFVYDSGSGITPSTTRREARTLDSQARYARWQTAYRALKQRRPQMSDVWYARQIAKQEVAAGCHASTIRRSRVNS